VRTTAACSTAFRLSGTRDRTCGSWLALPCAQPGTRLQGFSTLYSREVHKVEDLWCHREHPTTHSTCKQTTPGAVKPGLAFRLRLRHSTPVRSALPVSPLRRLQRQHPHAQHRHKLQTSRYILHTLLPRRQPEHLHYPSTREHNELATTIGYRPPWNTSKTPPRT
jgi:hypothetical protein